jgi:hypothetical protein
MQRWKATYEYLVKESLPEVGRLSTQRFPRELSQRKDDKRRLMELHLTTRAATLATLLALVTLVTLEALPVVNKSLLYLRRLCLIFK